MISLPRIVKAQEVNYKESVLIPSMPASTAHKASPPVTDDDTKQDTSSFLSHTADTAFLTEEMCKQALDAARQEADSIIARAHAKAQALGEQISAAAADEANRLKEQARAEGFVQGKEQATQQLQSKLDDITALLDRIDDRQRELIDGTEESIKLLVVDIVRKIVGKTLKEDDKALVGIVERALSSYKNTDWVKITISETDASTSCITDKSVLMELLDLSGSIEIEVLEDGASGLCIVETPDGIADASVETQLCNLKEILTRD